jgi:PAS domain S-box-containing protein
MSSDKKTIEELKQENESLKNEIQRLEEEKRRRRLMEEDRVISEERLDFSWAGNLGRWDWDYPTGRVSFNPKKVEVLGYSFEEFAPFVDSFTNLIHPDDYEATMQNMREHLMGERSAYETEYRMRCSDGSYRWFYDRGNVVEREKDGKPLKLVGIVFDVTEQKMAEEELKRSKAALEEALASKDRFFSIIAHDLKSPFNAFLGLTEILSTDLAELSTSQVYDYARMLNQSASQLFKLLENLLEWSRLQREMFEFQFDTINLRETVQSNLELFMPAARKKSIKLSTDISHDLFVYADRNSLNTIIRNLLSNAIKFTNTGGSVSIEATEEDQYAHIHVKDSGTGIPADVQQKIFSIDFKHSTRGTDNETGSGLGLILCRELAEKNNGSMTLTESTERGSVFTVRLPLPEKGDGPSPS